MHVHVYKTNYISLTALTLSAMMSKTGSHWSFPPPLPVGAMFTPPDLYLVGNLYQTDLAELVLNQNDT